MSLLKVDFGPLLKKFKFRNHILSRRISSLRLQMKKGYPEQVRCPWKDHLFHSVSGQLPAVQLANPRTLKLSNSQDIADHSLSVIAKASALVDSSGKGNRGSSVLVFVFLVTFKGAVIVKDDALRFGRVSIWGRREMREEGADDTSPNRTKSCTATRCTAL